MIGFMFDGKKDSPSPPLSLDVFSMTLQNYR